MGQFSEESFFFFFDNCLHEHESLPQVGTFSLSPHIKIKKIPPMGRLYPPDLNGKTSIIYKLFTTEKRLTGQQLLATDLSQAFLNTGNIR